MDILRENWNLMNKQTYLSQASKEDEGQAFNLGGIAKEGCQKRLAR